MVKLHLDFETRSKLDIMKVGAWKYAMHPSTEITCMAWAFEGEDPKVFTADAIVDGGFGTAWLGNKNIQIHAFSAHFEYAIFNYILHKRYDWPAMWDPRQWSCTQARALMCGLPATLEKVGAAIGVKMRKDLTGRAAMLKLCKPKGFDALGDPIWNEDPELYKLLYHYCAQDVRSEMALDAALPDLLPQERRVWEMDLIMNRRGVKVDVQTSRHAEEIADQLKRRLNAKLFKMTDGYVTGATKLAAMKTYLAARGYERESLDKEEVFKMLSDPTVSDHIKEVLKIRVQVGKSSTAKYTKTIEAASDIDERVRGAQQYHAATTGRWGGRLIQPHNYPQGFNLEQQTKALKFIAEGEPFFSYEYGDQSMKTLSYALRGTIIADKGKVLDVADFNAIEARVLFWLAGDQHALGMYARGESPYIDMAQSIFKNLNITKESHPFEYKIGKFSILGSGYQMAGPRFRGTCASYGVDITEDFAAGAIKAYRTKYQSVVRLWHTVGKAAANAIRTPGSVQMSCGGRVAWVMDPKREYLCCRLPSGRYLRYYRPSLKTKMTEYGEREEIRFWGVDSKTKQFVEQGTYGGKLVENITQATARDIMSNGMLNCENAGYPIVLTVHDEIVDERDSAWGSLEEFIKLMCDTPEWAADCPIVAEGWTGVRYRK